MALNLYDLVDLRTEERLPTLNDSDAEFVYLVRYRAHE